LPPNDSDFALTSLTERQREQALERFRILAPFIHQEISLTEISRSTNTPIRTLRRWVSQYNENGFAGLVRRKRKTRLTRIPEEMSQLIEGLALQSSNRTVTCIKREIDARAIQKGWPTFGYHSLRRIIRNLEPGLLSLAHEGPKTYSDRFDLIYRRESTRPNETWQADHTQLDCWVKDDEGQPRAPWLSVIMDEYSRSICAFGLSFDAPEAMRTALLLRQAIWRKGEPKWYVQGIPERFYTDHGSDFTSQHMEQVAADIRMQLIFSRHGKPRGRGKLERFFGSVNELFLCHIPGNKLTGGRPEDAVLTLAQISKRLGEWILADYQTRMHSELGISPNEKWTEHAFIPRMPDSLELLDLLLLTVAKPRMVQPDGIHFQSLRYVNPILASYVRESVIIRYDPQDLAEVRVYHENRFLCRAFCNELESQKVSLKEIESARRQRRNELSKLLTSRRRAVESYVQSHTAKSNLPNPRALPKATTTHGLKTYENE